MKEYKAVQINHMGMQHLTDELNAWAQNGWKFITATVDEFCYTLFFERDN